ncbi:MAG TPA: alpha/beta hydrolase, partial [Candidatus Eisenbacteria bacterium]|nr:alpha/beta hydrolase [Candidatus Eisenbacteria bacterium]
MSAVFSILTFVWMPLAEPATASAGPDTAGLGAFLAMVNRPVALRVPGMERVRVTQNLSYRRVPGVDLSADVYLPASSSHGTAPHPIAILLHGGVGPGLKPRPKDWGNYRSWGRLLAASGVVTVTFNQRLGFPKPEIENAMADVESLTAFVRRNAQRWGADPDRIAMVSFSAGGMLLGPPIRRRPPWLRCIVAIYPIIDLRVSTHLRQHLTAAQLEE